MTLTETTTQKFWPRLLHELKGHCWHKGRKLRVNRGGQCNKADTDLLYLKVCCLCPRECQDVLLKDWY